MRSRHLAAVVLALVAVPVALCLAPSRAAAQTQDDFFSAAEVREVRLTLSRRDWQALTGHPELNTYYAADLRWNGITLRNVGIRSRGHFTRNSSKPGLRVDVNRYLSEQRFLGLAGFSLDNAYSDPSLMRERLAMSLFARIGIPAPRETHARLFVNDEYVGVYAIVEQVDRAFVAGHFGGNEAGIERGGHLFEYRWVRPYGFEYLGPELEAYAELFTPQTRETDSMSGLFEDIEELIRTINEAPDDRFADLVGARIDLPQVMRYVAVENFLSDPDGLLGHWGLHNFYLFRPVAGGPARLIPWDKDSTFSAPDHPLDFHVADNVLVRRALDVPALQQIYAETLLTCARLASERDPDSLDPRGWLEREVDRVADAIRAGVANDPVVPFTLEQFDAEVEWLRQFARLRPAFVGCALGDAETAGGWLDCGPTVPLAREP